MTDAALRTTDELLTAALDLAPTERAAFLDTHAPPPLRAYVGRLLAAAEADDPLLDEAPVSVGEIEAATGVGTLTAIGEEVGPYRIVGHLGEGGMGRVYRAERADGAFERTVALKLVRRSLALAGADVAERLRRERAVLASLEHPNIARLYGGGETEDGVPWVAMELVEGEPITTYASARALDIRARTALAVDVCRAVEHAHRRLVVHRDLKPSNVFVAEDEDGTPVVKLLDFGIARLLDVDVEGLTRTGTPLLTPEYAAPEQVSDGEITTATDVWALGALFYELLAGRRPYAAASATGTGDGSLGRLRALERRLREPPAAPSRADDDPRSARALRGDLDAIVLQALRPESERRYASAGALGDDLARHLDGLPVVARPASRWYRASRFVRRNRGAVTATAAIVAALVAGLAASLQSLGREREARADAQAEVVRATAAFEFVVDLFGGSDGAPLSMETSAGDLLAAGERRAGAIGAGREADRAVAFSALREVYGRLQLYDAALRTGDEALRATRQAYGLHHPHTLDASGSYALNLVHTSEFDQALRLVEATARGYRDLGDSGQRPLGRLLSTFGAFLAVSSFDESASEEWVEVAEQMLDEAEPMIRAARDSVALIDLLRGRAHLVELQDGMTAAAPIHAEVYRLARAFYGDSYESLLVQFNYGVALGSMGDYDAAVPVFDTVIVNARRTIGSGHGSVTSFLAHASNALLQRGRPGDVEQALAWTAEADRPHARDHWGARVAAANRLTALRAAGRWWELDERSASAITRFEASGDFQLRSWARLQRAFARLGLGDFPRARELAEDMTHDDDGEIETLAHLILACIATSRGDADQTRAALDAAQRALDASGLPPHALTPRLFRAGPAGGACDGWVPGR